MQKKVNSTARAMLGMIIMASLVSLAACVFLYRRDGFQVEHFLFGLFCLYVLPGAVLLWKYPDGIPRWGRVFVPRWIEKDFRERMAYSTPKHSGREFKGAMLLCLVNAFGGVGYGLLGIEGMILMTLAGLLVAWQIKKAWIKE